MKTSDQVMKEIQGYFNVSDSEVYSICTVGIGAPFKDGYPEVFVNVRQNKLVHPVTKLFNEDENVIVEVDSSAKTRKYGKKSRPKKVVKDFTVEVKKNRRIPNVLNRQQ